MFDLAQDVFAFLSGKRAARAKACDNKIQHLLCENIQKQAEIIVA